MKFYLFYSNKCSYCQQILQIINNENLSNYCKIICFETDSDKIPKIIENVPTIIAESLSKPLVGTDAINWIQNKKYFNQITNNININTDFNPNIKQNNDLSYNKSESSSISDHYINLNDTDIEKTMLDYNKINTSSLHITNDLTNDLKNSDERLEATIHDKKIKDMIAIRKQQIMMRSNGLGQTSKLKN